MHVHGFFLLSYVKERPVFCAKRGSLCLCCEGQCFDKFRCLQLAFFIPSDESCRLSEIPGVGITKCGHIDRKDLDTDQ